MNYFLMLIIMCLCGGAYYEYGLLQKKSLASEQEIADLNSALDTIKAKDAKLGEDNARLTQTAQDDQSKIAELTKQIRDAQSATTASPPTSLQPSSIGKVSNPIPTPGTNNLGTIGTLDGKTFASCQLLKVQTDGIVISYSGGITQVPYGLMPPDLQRRFGFDPRTTVALTQDQVDVQEQKRKAAGQTAGN